MMGLTERIILLLHCSSGLPRLPRLVRLMTGWNHHELHAQALQVVDTAIGNCLRRGSAFRPLKWCACTNTMETSEMKSQSFTRDGTVFQYARALSKGQAKIKPTARTAGFGQDR